MKKIPKLLQEVNKILGRVDLFFIILRTLAVLTGCYLLFYLFGFFPFLAVFPAAVYFVSSLLIEGYLDHVKRIEFFHPFMQDKLLTGRDYADKEGEVLDALESEIVEDMHHVKVSTFVPFQRLIVLVLIIMITAGASVYVSQQGFVILDFGKALQRALEDYQQDPEEQVADFTGGEVSVMEVGNDRLEVEINPVGIDFDFSETQDIGSYSFGTSFPQEIFISSGAAYGNEFTEEQQMLIKRYFDTKGK